MTVKRLPRGDGAQVTEEDAGVRDAVLDEVVELVNEKHEADPGGMK